MKERVRENIIICETCGKAFRVKPSKAGTAKYCSRDCFCKKRSADPEWSDDLYSLYD